MALLVRHMPNEDLSALLAALADPTRRAVVEHLRKDGPLPVKALSARHDMALPSFLQHLDVLEDRRIIRTQKVGRRRMCSLEPHALAPLEAWVAQHQRGWAKRLDRLDKIATDRDRNDPLDGDPI